MENKPSDIAKLYLKSKKELGTNKAVAHNYGVSESTVSRYLKILKNKKGAIDSIDKGKKPIREKKKIKRVSSQITNKETMLVDYLSRCIFATNEQSSVELDTSVSNSRNTIETLKTKGILNINKEYTPFIISLTRKGCVIAGVEKPKHYYSGQSIHQRLMRNKIEHELKKKNGTARFISRTQCWDMGLFPAVGEHLLSITKDDGNKELILVLIDDYGISPNRIEKMLARTHDEQKSVVKGDHSLTWTDAVKRLIIYSTMEKQIKNFKDYLNKNTFDKCASMDVRHIHPVWK